MKFIEIFRHCPKCIKSIYNSIYQIVNNLMGGMENMRIRFSAMLLFFSLVTGVALHADLVLGSAVERAGGFLQVGAFSQKENFDRMRRRLKRFPLWSDRIDGMRRLFVVLPANRAARKGLFRRVRVIVPDAFVRHGYRPDGSGTSGGIGEESRPLDARAILQTRKRFF